MGTSLPLIEIFSILIAAVAIVISLWAAIGTRKNEKEMVILQRRQVDLSEIQELRARIDADEARQRSNEERQLKLARSLRAWWARDPAGDWGVVIENNGDQGVLSAVEIAVSNNNRQDTIKFQTMVAGTYFAKSSFEKFEFPKTIQSIEAFEPINNSKKHSVISSKFSDQLGQRWQIKNGSKAIRINV